MLVKIGRYIYDSSHEPIAVIMAPNEQELLREMPSGQNMLCLYPAMTKATDVEIFMQEAQAQAQMRLNSKIRLQ